MTLSNRQLCEHFHLHESATSHQTRDKNQNEILFHNSTACTDPLKVKETFHSSTRVWSNAVFPQMLTKLHLTHFWPTSGQLKLRGCIFKYTIFDRGKLLLPAKFVSFDGLSCDFKN